MKKQTDPRHQKRRQAVQELFALSFQQKPRRTLFLRQLEKKREKIDQIISQSAPAFPLEKIGKIDLAILRLAIFELLERTAPVKVIIDEAVELAKEYGGETSFSFVNGVLGTVVKTHYEN